MESITTPQVVDSTATHKYVLVAPISTNLR